MQPSHDCCCQQSCPMVVLLYALPWPAASPKRELAASREAGQRCRGHHDHHLLRFLSLAGSSPEHSCPFHPDRFLPYCFPSRMDEWQQQWIPSPGTIPPRVLTFSVPPVVNRSFSCASSSSRPFREEEENTRS